MPDEDITFEGDSSDYDVLENAAKDIAAQIINHQFNDTVISFCEIGVWLGLGTFKMFNGIIETLQINKHAPQHFIVGIGVDPYGNIEYDASEGVTRQRFDYTNIMRNKFMKNIYAFACKIGFDYIFLNLEDTEFFKRFSDGVPYYARNKYLVNKYHLVHFDGPHVLDNVMTEVQFFYERSVKGTIFVFDDINQHQTADDPAFTHPKKVYPATYQPIHDSIDNVWYEFYNHSHVERWLFEHGFALMEKKTTKAAYKRVN